MSDLNFTNARLESILEALERLTCPESELRALRVEVKRIAGIIAPPDGTGGPLAHIQDLARRLDALEREKDEQRKERLASKTAMVIAIISAVAAIIAAALKH